VTGDAAPASGAGVRFLNAGEAALVVEFGSAIDPTLQARVLELDRALAAARIDGIVEAVPTYRSLMIHYDPTRIEPQALIERLQVLPASRPDTGSKVRRWLVPACYAPDCAPDLDAVAEALGLAPEHVVALHSGATYRIYMYGFAPGFAYLGGLPAELAISRRATPRPRAEASSLLIAGGQALITTVAMPTGWHVLGRTPERFFSLARDPVVLAAVGDEVRFDPVDEPTFAALAARAQGGEVIARMLDAN
jgi:KipI family sensor histidine kinase inhibitor